jgi:predicted metalloprotease
MRWEGHRESENVEDARGAGASSFPFGGGSLSLGTIAIAVVAGWLFGINPLSILGLMDGGSPNHPAQVQRPPADDTMARFVSTVLADTEDVWHQKFRQVGRTYREPRLQIYRGTTRTACGTGQSAMGPFYCPADERVYIDLGFYEVMKSRLGAPGDFAQAYVIAHEVGHHVQKLLGVTEQVEAMSAQAGGARANALSVRLELQADCYAGVWAHDAQTARQVLEEGDIEEALNAASQIGDDALQRRSQGKVVPESFTHGTSTQRVTWFKRGFQTGSVAQCDTFRARQL